MDDTSKAAAKVTRDIDQDPLARNIGSARKEASGTFVAYMDDSAQPHVPALAGNPQ